MEKKKVATKVAPKEPKKEEPSAFEDRKDIKKLLLLTVIVNFGQGDNIIRILKNNHSSAQMVQMGEGTATKQILNILNIEDNRKEVLYSLVREDYISDIKKELEAYFAASKRNKGIAYTIKLDSIVGVKLYKFFTQTVRG